jgi:hypothetical protein
LTRRQCWSPSIHIDFALCAAAPMQLAREAMLDHLLPLSEQLIEGPQRGLWSLSFSERRTALRRLATPENMRQALDANPDRPDALVQHMFERLVDGDPIALSELSRDEIAALLNTLDWVEDILDGLPEKTAVRSALAKADLLAPMRRLADCSFVGRQRELAQLDDYGFSRLQPQTAWAASASRRCWRASFSNPWSRGTRPLSTSISIGPLCGRTAH